MRDIKFRAWDGKHNKMLNWDKEPYLSFYIGDYGDILKGAFDDILSDKKLTLMQYTGLKDKNGKEIYESDFINFQGRTYRVDWSDEYTCYQIIDLQDEEKYYEHLRDIDTDMEIIGNIWENPELIGKYDLP